MRVGVMMALCTWAFINVFGQSPLSVNGIVADARTKEPLGFATIAIKHTARGSISDPKGKFVINVPKIFPADTRVVTHLGYATFEVALHSFQFGQTIFLEESYTLLDVVTISRVIVNTRSIEKDLRQIRGNLFAMESEVTNTQYN